METYFDVHTHKTDTPEAPNGVRVLQLRSISVAQPAECAALIAPRKENDSNTYYSVGWHPWHTIPSLQELENTLTKFLENERVIAVGEAGLDSLRGAPLEIQEPLFLLQARLAEIHHLPLVVHCVKTIDRIYALRKEMHPTIPWILHGFRGKPEQMMQWLRLPGTLVGFGARFHEESVHRCPTDRFLLETDESPQSILSIYKEVARVRKEDKHQLCAQLQQNWHTNILPNT